MHLFVSQTPIRSEPNSREVFCFPLIWSIVCNVYITLGAMHDFKLGVGCICVMTDKVVYRYCNAFPYVILVLIRKSQLDFVLIYPEISVGFQISIEFFYICSPRLHLD